MSADQSQAMKRLEETLKRRASGEYQINEPQFVKARVVERQGNTVIRESTILVESTTASNVAQAMGWLEDAGDPQPNT
jgi:hypothetical protein